MPSLTFFEPDGIVMVECGTVMTLHRTTNAPERPRILHHGSLSPLDIYSEPRVGRVPRWFDVASDGGRIRIVVGWSVRRLATSNRVVVVSVTSSIDHSVVVRCTGHGMRRRACGGRRTADGERRCRSLARCFVIPLRPEQFSHGSCAAHRPCRGDYEIGRGEFAPSR